MTDITLDIWLYGDLARYGGQADQGSFAHLELKMSENCSMGSLLSFLNLPTAERGITFINGDLSAMPGLQPDLEHVFHDGDRVAFFHLQTMWPFQYRQGSAMTGEMAQAMLARKDQGLHHTYD